MKPSIPFKVACGFVLLTCLFLGTVYAIYHQTQALTQIDEQEQTAIARRKATQQLICLLFESENIAQTVRMGHEEAYHVYEKAIRKVQMSIAKMDSLTKDSLQSARLDTLSLLVNQKKNNLRQLLMAMASEETNKVYQKKIAQILAQKDSVIQQPKIEKKIIQTEKSYTVEKPKKKFFKRLAEAFRPSKDDTTKVSQSTQVLAIDTLSLEYNTADTLAHILTDIEDEVQQSRTQRQKRISRQAERLRYANIEMSHRLAQLFENIEQDEQERAFKEATAATALRQKTSLIFVAVTVASVLLAIVFFILVWKDNQRSNHYRKELEKAKNKAEGLLIAREKLMLTITHDIKAPAGSILGYLDLLSPLINEKKPVFYIKNIKSAATHLLNLVNSLLDYHRLEAQKMDINPVSFNPAQLMKTIYENFIPAATQKELLIHYEQDPDTDCTCRGDAFRIRQITENLISNAIKFTDKGSISLSIQLKDNKLSFQVRDTGCGMTSDEQNRIFQEFTRLQSAQGKEGFGLGLSITHKLVELLNGTIDVESARGKGTCFNVNIPIEITSEKNIISEKEANYTDKTIINCNQLPETLKILIIDDDQIQLQLTKAMFEQWKKQNLKITNWNIVTCTHPKELLDIIRKERFNVLLTDIQMPALNGIELLKTIRQTQPSSNETMPVIALTARQDLTESDFKEKGFATCLYKPFNINDLAIALNKAINIPFSKKKDPDVHPHVDNNKKDVIQLQSLTAFAGNDEKASKEILSTFLEENIHHLNQLQEAIKQKDKTTICQLAHKLLPTFTLICSPTVPILLSLDQKRNEQEWDETDSTIANKMANGIKEVISCLQKEIGI